MFIVLGQWWSVGSWAIRQHSCKDTVRCNLLFVDFLKGTAHTKLAT